MCYLMPLILKHHYKDYYVVKEQLLVFFLYNIYALQAVVQIEQECGEYRRKPVPDVSGLRLCVLFPISQTSSIYTMSLARRGTSNTQVI